MIFSMWAWLSEATPTCGGVNSMTSQKADRGFGPGYGPSHSPLAEEQLAEAQWMDYEAFEEQGGTSITTDLSQNERAVHVDFFNDFDDIFNDENLD